MSRIEENNISILIVYINNANIEQLFRSGIMAGLAFCVSVCIDETFI